MVHRCIICGDTSNIKKPNISFHAFPVHEVRRNKWLDAINKEGIVLKHVPTKHSRICSKHFKESCFVHTRLRIDAVPTIFKMPNLSSIKNQLRNKFPKDTTKRAKWLHALRMTQESLKRGSLVCSNHFAATDFFANRECGIRCLHRNAIPTLTLENSPLCNNFYSNFETMGTASIDLEEIAPTHCDRPAPPPVASEPNSISDKRINLQGPELWTNLFPVALTTAEIKIEPTESLSLESNSDQDPLSISNDEQASSSKQTLINVCNCSSGEQMKVTAEYNKSCSPTVIESTNASDSGQNRFICNNSSEEPISSSLNEKTLTLEKRIVAVPLLKAADTNKSIPTGIEIINKNVIITPLSNEILEPIKEYYVFSYESLKDIAETNKVTVKNELFSDASFTNTRQDNDFRYCLKSTRIEMKAAKRILSNLRKKLKSEYQRNRRLESRVIRMRNVVKNLRKRR